MHKLRDLQGVFGFIEVDISYLSTCPTSWLILQYTSGHWHTGFDYVL